MEKNLVSGVLYEPISTSSTMLLVTIGENVGASAITAFFPTPPFHITVMPKAPTIGVANNLDSEIMKVTSVSHDQVGNAALICTRAQRGTTAKAFESGSIVTVGIYVEDVNLDNVVYSDNPGEQITPQPWIEPTEMKWSTFPKCKAYSETKVTIGNEAYFALDQLKYNVGGFSINGGTVTIPKTGKYLVSGWVSGLSDVTISGFVQLRTTGGKIFGVAINRPSSDIYCSIMIPATICDLSQGDRIGIYNLDQPFRQNSGIDAGFFGTQLNIVYIGD